jgi:hypothetical protein
MEEKKQRNLEVFEWFKTHVIDKKPDPSIDHRELASATDIILLVHVMFAGEKKKRKEIQNAIMERDVFLNILA